MRLIPKNCLEIALRGHVSVFTYRWGREAHVGVEVVTNGVYDSSGLVEFMSKHYGGVEPGVRRVLESARERAR